MTLRMVSCDEPFHSYMSRAGEFADLSQRSSEGNGITSEHLSRRAILFRPNRPI